jgi:hypothetical protein
MQISLMQYPRFFAPALYALSLESGDMLERYSNDAMVWLPVAPFDLKPGDCFREKGRSAEFEFSYVKEWHDGLTDCCSAIFVVRYHPPTKRWKRIQAEVDTRGSRCI